MSFKPAHMINLRLAGTPHIEGFSIGFGNGEITNQFAILIQHWCQIQTAHLRHFIRHQVREKRFRTRTCEAILRKIRNLGHSHAIAGAQNFGLHMGKIIAAVEGENVFWFNTLRGKP